MSPAGIADWKERLWQSLVAFEAVQMEHSQAFASGRCDNVMARQTEREKVFACLQMDLESAHHALLVGEDRDFAHRVLAKFSALIDQETVLAERARQVRQHLLDEMGAIRQGKKVLKGYGQRYDGSPHPRVVNRKT